MTYDEYISDHESKPFCGNYGKYQLKSSENIYENSNTSSNIPNLENHANYTGNQFKSNLNFTNASDLQSMIENLFPDDVDENVMNKTTNIFNNLIKDMDKGISDKITNQLNSFMQNITKEFNSNNQNKSNNIAAHFNNYLENITDIYNNHNTCKEETTFEVSI